MFIIAALVARWLRYTLAQTRSLQIASIFYNSANYGLPLMALYFVVAVVLVPLIWPFQPFAR